jgi:hypothetical protein
MDAASLPLYRHARSSWTRLLIALAVVGMIAVLLALAAGLDQQIDVIAAVEGRDPSPFRWT